MSGEQDAEQEFERQVHIQMERIGELLNANGLERDGPVTLAMLNHVVDALVASGMPRAVFLETCESMFDWYTANEAAQSE